jgi:hypothetical protein
MSRVYIQSDRSREFEESDCDWLVRISRKSQSELQFRGEASEFHGLPSEKPSTSSFCHQTFLSKNPFSPTSFLSTLIINIAQAPSHI